jgi:hypothetical protein
MTTRLAGEVRRELEVDGRAYIVGLSPDGVSIRPKGGRKRRILGWRELVSGDAELRRDLRVSIDAYEGRSEPPAV